MISIDKKHFVQKYTKKFLHKQHNDYSKNKIIINKIIKQVIIVLSLENILFQPENIGVFYVLHDKFIEMLIRSGDCITLSVCD